MKSANSIPVARVVWTKMYITVAGVLGVITGLMGFTDNPFVVDPGIPGESLRSRCKQQDIDEETNS